MKYLEDLIKFIIKWRKLSIAFLLLCLVLSVYQIIHNLRVDNALTIWFLEDDPSYQAYIEFQETYGSDEIYIAMLPVENALGVPEKGTLLQLHQAIDSLPFVKTTFSLAKAKYPIYANGRIIFDDLYNTERSSKGLKSLLSKLPNITQQLITKDFKNQFFYIQLKPTPSIEGQRDLVGRLINQKLENFYPHYYLTGPPVLNDAYSQGIFKESMWFGIMTVLVITLILLFLLPSKRYLFLALCAVAAPLIILFGIISSLGYSLNMISMLIPTILMVYTVSDVVHIINIYHKEGIKESSVKRIPLLKATVTKSFIPCFYTTLTTLVGYFALYLSPLPAFKTMGVFTCLGLVLSFLLVYIISIIGFSFMSLDFSKLKPVMPLKGRRALMDIQGLNTQTTRYKKTIVLGFSLLLIVGGFAVFQVKIDTNSLDLLAEGKAKKDLRIVENKLQGSSRLQLNIATDNNISILNKSALKRLEDFQKKLEQNPLVTAPVSIVNLKSFLEKRTPVLFKDQVSEASIKQILGSIDQDKNTFFTFFGNDFNSTGITLSFKELNTSQIEQLISDIKTDFKNTFPEAGYRLEINGFAVVFAQLNDFILQTQFKSFFAAFFVAFLCLWVFIKSVRTTLLVLIPNILPLMVLAIVMTVFDINLNVTTAMITPIMLGIAMDDTIHLIYKYKTLNYENLPVVKRIDQAMLYTGSALISTTIALVAGFIIIGSSAVPSVSEFGVLCAITVAVALITDILYLPALLKVFDK